MSIYNHIAAVFKPFRKVYASFEKHLFFENSTHTLFTDIGKFRACLV